MSYIFLVMLLIGALIWPKSKYITLLSIIFMTIIIGLNTNSPDWYNNEYMYNNIDGGMYKYYEPGYVMLIRICRYFGLAYSEFRFVVASIFSTVLYIGICSLTNRCAIAASIALIYPCIVFASALRSAIAFAIVIMAFSLLLAKHKHNSIKYCILIIFASMFHFSAIINLVFLLCQKNITRRDYCFMIICDILIISLVTNGTLYSFMSEYVASAKVLAWFDVDKYRHPSILSCICMLFTYSIVFILTYNRNGYANILQHEVIYRNNVIKIMSLIVPLLCLNFTFERLLQYSVYFILCTNKSAAVIANLRGHHKLLKFCNISDLQAISAAVFLNVAFYYVVHNNLYFPLLQFNKLFQ